MSDTASEPTKVCPICGEVILAVAKKCRFCGEYFDPEFRQAQARAQAPPLADRLLLPVGRPISAIAAGYCALFAILPLIGIPFAIAALSCGIVALRRIKADPSLSGKGRAWFGIIVGGLMTGVSLVGLVAIIIAAIVNPQSLR